MLPRLSGDAQFTCRIGIGPRRVAQRLVQLGTLRFSSSLCGELLRFVEIAGLPLIRRSLAVALGGGDVCGVTSYGVPCASLLTGRRLINGRSLGPEIDRACGWGSWSRLKRGDGDY